MAFADVLLDVYEAAACLVEQDRHDLAHEQDSMKVKQLEFNHLKKQYTKSVVAKATDKARGRNC